MVKTVGTLFVNDKVKWMLDAIFEFFRVKPCHLELCHREVTRRSEPPEFSKSNRVLRRLRVGVIVHVFNASCLFLFFLLFGLTSINFLVFSFPFHMSFCSFFHTCTISLVEAIALWTWKATSGMSYPRSETVFFLFLVLRSFSEDHHIFCCPCGLILLFSSFGFSLAFVSSRTVKIK